MSINVVIQAKTLDVLESEARFFGVHPTALAKAIIDKVTTGGMVRDVLQGVDVSSYQVARKGRKPKHFAMFMGVQRSVSEVAAEFGISYSVARERVKSGWTLEEAVTTPVGPQGRRQPQRGAK